MAGLELRFLGDFEVRRDGRAVPLPPSKKTRALLAYLCLQPRRFSREQLCQLLWEVPDDPRGSLRNVCALADLKMNRLLASIDEWAERNGLAGVAGPAERYAPTEVGASPRLSLVLGKDVRTLIWATGFRPDHSWLDVPVFDRKGELKHDRGIVDAPGLYVLGLPYLRRRKSSFMHGAEDDVRELGAHLAGYLDRATTPVQDVRRNMEIRVH